MKIHRVLEQIESYYNRARMIPYEDEDGTIKEFLEARRGNSTYANRKGEELTIYRQRFLQGIIDDSVLFITIGTPYISSYYGCRDSWETMSKAIGPYIRKLRRMGATRYIAVLEATSEGLCHCHLLLTWKRPLKKRRVKDKYLLAEKDLLKVLWQKWEKEWMKVSDLPLNNNAIAVRVCSGRIEADTEFKYITKYLGYGSNISNALYRAKMGNETPADSEKLFSNYWAFSLKKKIRLFRRSRNLGKNG